ncbi:hypothetical protein N7533_000969 [Penicillium manginii]|uniref:uncharacterized protein n=1 Tax=Penicillium manginii TaxID=203109 RepID=UPI002547FDE8|nr:uncharacterized protein N7533_000969 [Penicillium manginii]KAJ5768386.1 hypothetical protein N7533_000969 [Penicillium manginii]
MPPHCETSPRIVERSWRVREDLLQETWAYNRIREPVDMAAWVEVVEASSENASDIPAVKLLDTSKGLTAERPSHP